MNTRRIRKQNRLIADMQKGLVICTERHICHNIFISQNLVQSMALALVKSVKAEKDEEAAKVAEVSSRAAKGKRKEVSLHNIKLQGEGLSWWSGGLESVLQFRKYGFLSWLSTKIPHTSEQLSLCTTATEPSDAAGDTVHLSKGSHVLQLRPKAAKWINI